MLNEHGNAHMVNMHIW